MLSPHIAVHSSSATSVHANDGRPQTSNHQIAGQNQRHLSAQLGASPLGRQTSNQGIHGRHNSGQLGGSPFDLGRQLSNQGIRPTSRSNSITPSIGQPRGSFQGSIGGRDNQQRQYGFQRDESIIIQWSEKRIDDAPEVGLLSKSLSSGPATNPSCVTKLIQCFGTVCKSRVADSCGLDNFKPVRGRTEKTLDYVFDLIKTHSVKIKYGSAIAFPTNSKSSIGSKSKDSSKQKLIIHMKGAKHVNLRDFCDKAHKSLQTIERCIDHFKNIIFALTYSKYAEEELTETEIKMTKGRTIIGSCIWIVVFALQQLQEDPELEPVENQPKPHQGIHELAGEVQYLLNQSFFVWHEVVSVIAAVEKVHRRTEEVFEKQTRHLHSKAAPDSDSANMLGVHLKKHRRADSDIDELKNLKSFDPYASMLTWNKRIGQSRILYKLDYTKEDSLWSGFDPLSADKKIAHLKDILNYARLILEYVKETVQKISVELHGRSRSSMTYSSMSAYASSGITTYEEGINAMDDILQKKMTNIDWEQQEVTEFFEIDKIFLDTMDLLTLGAGVTRSIVHEARHIIHICYETSRLLDFREFINLPAYERVYLRMKDDFAETNKYNPKKLKRLSANSNSYDISEIHLELRNVAGLFRTSTYQEILKQIPLYTNRVGMTLQDGELVFSPSSEKLLS